MEIENKTMINKSFEIKNIGGLTVKYDSEGKRRVYFEGERCSLIHRTEERVKLDTPYNGCLTHSSETYHTPIGVVERVYRAWGGGLEYSSTDYRLIPREEIAEAQAEYTRTWEAFQDARQKLLHLTANDSL